MGQAWLWTALVQVAVVAVGVSGTETESCLTLVRDICQCRPPRPFGLLKSTFRGRSPMSSLFEKRAPLPIKRGDSEEEMEEALLPIRRFVAKPKPLPIKRSPLPLKRRPLPLKRSPLPLKRSPLPLKRSPLPLKRGDWAKAAMVAAQCCGEEDCTLDQIHDACCA